MMASLAYQGYFPVLLVLNIFLATTATLGNVMILIVLYKVSSIHPTTKLLFRCLAATDLSVGLIEQPLFVVIMLKDYFPTNAYYYVHEVYSVLSFVLCGVSLITASAISVDRLLALLLGLRYSQIVTLNRVRAIIVSFWLASISAGSLYYFGMHSMAYAAAFLLIILSLFISVFSYIKILVKLRHQRVQMQHHAGHEQVNGGGFSLNIARYKKIVSTIAWVQLAMFVCYMPLIIVLVPRVVIEQYYEKPYVDLSAMTVLFLNSSLNPILYCWRIAEVRQVAKNTVRQFCRCLSS